MSESFAPLVDRIGGIRRVQMALVGLGTVGVIWAFTSWAMAPVFVPIGQNMPMDVVSEAQQRLADEGIEVRLEAGGTSLSVPETSLAAARVALAASGITANPSAPGFELFDQPSWGMTDFTQRVNYRRALEGELERTIGNMRGVESAQVHLAIQESSVLRAATRPSEASVVLALYSGMPSDPAVVDGIASLVAASVEGLDKANVMVLDDAGRLLSDDEAADSGMGLSRRQLDMRRETERYLESKAEQLLARVVGPGNASVRVSAEMNFDQTTSTTDRVDPDAVVPVSESSEEIRPGEGQVGAGQTVTSTQYETTRSRETFQSGAARIERLSVAVIVNERATENADGTIAYTPREAQEMQRIEQLVRSAVGISTERSDEISVVSVPFEAPLETAAPAEEGLDVVGLAQTFSRPLIGLAGLLTALVLGLRLIANLKEAPAPRGRALAGAATAPGLPAGSKAPVEQATATPAPPQYVSQPQAPTVQLQDPAMTARVLKAWMKEA